MRDGFRVYDTDTHIDPGADVLEKFVDPSFRPRLDDLSALLTQGSAWIPMEQLLATLKKCPAIANAGEWINQ